jgi:uridine kinase
VSFEEALLAVIDMLLDRTSCKVCAVAVDGHSAAGKSSFGHMLAHRVGAALVTGDDFYRVMGEADRSRLSPRQGIDCYYDWQRMRDVALIPLRNGQPATYRPFDWDTGQLATRTVTIPAASIVVVEGLYVSRPELHEFFDLAVLVEAPVDVRWRRQRQRGDASEEWLHRWDAAERHFFAHVRPSDTFDVIVRHDETS